MYLCVGQRRPHSDLFCYLFVYCECIKDDVFSQDRSFAADSGLQQTIIFLIHSSTDYIHNQWIHHLAQMPLQFQFPEAQRDVFNFFFCPNPQNPSLTVRNEKEKQQILTFKKLELADNVDCFALKMTEIGQKQVYQLSIS